MRYKPRSIAALHVALGGLPATMRVEVDQDIGVSAKTVKELRKVTKWPENLVITTPQNVIPKAQSGLVRRGRKTALTKTVRVHFKTDFIANARAAVGTETETADAGVQ